MRREIVKIGGVVPIDETLSNWPGETGVDEEEKYGTEESLDKFLNHGIDRVNLRGRDLNVRGLDDRIDAGNYDGTSLGLNVVNPSAHHSQNLRSSLPSQLTGSNHGQWSTLSRDPGWVLIDDQLAKQLSITTITDDQISHPSVTPIMDSIGHHPPMEFSS
ncbi:hypothetical protein PPACK8108_LOCUS10844 [Phakopsora pachyrhizi]|uniref:Uncharacterized protein n=1 Tax=Phakopsora pachyrhizi TaxID=170000 RepID=A0AAV0B2B9_PHAPC|nr:hypothetical protein PPACK8108_LOCUS3081 [Phakopsora pachyrhizi]CAH7675787.1 hypothetical protein PPACK8108_LOCUS10844 [Phakopsora pachyrhizi]